MPFMSFKDILFNDILNQVADKCDISSLQLLTNTHLKIKENMDTSIVSKKIKEYFPFFLYRYIDFNNTYIRNAFQVDLEKNIGFTGYIDFISKKHFINDAYHTNIIFGRDSVSRFFISILYDVDITSSEYPQKKQKLITTFFQRYSSSIFGFVSCQTTFVNDNSCVQTHNFRNNDDETLGDQYVILFDLLNNGCSIHDCKRYSLSECFDFD